MMVIVVTGGIGSGKSEACRILHREYGIPVYEADAKVKELYSLYPSIVETLEGMFSCTLRDSGGHFIPSELAVRIFGDKEALAKVEAVVFPYLTEDFSAFCERNRGPVIFESATILEKEAFAGFGDVTILIDAPYEVRLERACSRDGSDRDRVIARMENQPLMNMLSQGGGSDRIDYRIENTGSLELLENKLKEVMDEILK